MYARIKDGIITELCPVNPFEIYCRELAECFYPCGEELRTGELAIIREGELYRDGESIALRRDRERARMALSENVKSVRQEGELLGLLGFLGQSGARVAELKADCEGRLGIAVSALCAVLGTDILSGQPSSGDIERIREVLYHGGN